MSLGIRPEVVSVEVDETPLDNEDPAAMVERLARLKALAAVEAGLVKPESLVVAADTTIDLDGVPVGKPTDSEDARRMLKALQGRTHQVVTGVAMALVKANEAEVEILTQTDRTAVTIAQLTDTDIDWYVSTGEPFGKAGAYTIQGVGSWMVTHIDGAFHSVVGLPSATLDTMARSFGWPLRALATYAEESAA